jgi:sugar lactone lactonase YvrE
MVWVADTHNYRLQKYSPQGEFVEVVGQQGSAPGEFEDPANVAVDGEGYLHVADSGHYRVQALTAAGEPLFQWKLPDTVPGEHYYAPTGLAVGKGRLLYVTDVGTGRIYKLTWH